MLGRLYIFEKLKQSMGTPLEDAETTAVIMSWL
jgi:hypothetical protein